MPINDGPDLVALDLDGTIINDRGDLDQLTALAIAIVAASGVRVVLATGRSPWVGVSEIARDLGLHGPQISLQGALVVDADDGDVHLAHALPARVYLDALLFADEASLDPIVSLADGHRTERAAAWPGLLSPVRTSTGSLRYVEDLADLAEEPPFRLYLPTGPDRHESVVAAATERFRDRATVLWTDTAGVEILAAGVDKGAALAWLASELDIPMSRVAAVGDGRNDMGMLVRAGPSAAMSSAPAEVKRIAQIVVPSVEQSGVVTALRCFFPHLVPEFEVMEAEADHFVAHLPRLAALV